MPHADFDEAAVLKHLKIDADRWLVLLRAEPREHYIVALVGADGRMKLGISHASLDGARLDFETRCVLSARTVPPAAF